MNNEPNMNENIPQQTPEAPATKRCPVCGKDVDAQAAFCGECGYNFNAGTAYTLPPQPQAPAEDTSPLKMSDYLLMFLVSCIPLVNIILLLIWSFSSGVNVNRRNFSRAYLIITLIAWILYFVLLVGFIGIIGALAAEEMYIGTVIPFIFR